MKICIPANIAQIKPYLPGKPQSELERELGIENSIKMASNENPWGPSPKAVRAVRSALLTLHRYPDDACFDLILALAEKHGVDQSEVILGNGSNEIIDFLVKALVGVGDEVITSYPSFQMYQQSVLVRGGVNNAVPLKNMRHDLDAIKGMVSDKTRIIFLDNPNNPTGTTIPPGDIYRFLSEIPESVTVVFDEAYIEYADENQKVDLYSLIRNVAGRCPVVFLRTFSKIYGLAGLRIGFALMAKEVVSILKKVRQPFSVNVLAQVGALAALEDSEYYEKTVTKTREGLIFLTEGAECLGCRVFPSQANFTLMDVRGNADRLYKAMLARGVIIRSMRDQGFESFIRVSVGTEEENKRFLKSLADCLVELKYA